MYYFLCKPTLANNTEIKSMLFVRLKNYTSISLLSNLLHTDILHLMHKKGNFASSAEAWGREPALLKL